MVGTLGRGLFVSVFGAVVVKEKVRCFHHFEGP